MDETRGRTLAGPATPVGAPALRPPVRARPEATLAEVAKGMREHGVSSVLVGDGAASIVTERNLVEALAAGLALTTPVSAVATDDPLVAARVLIPRSVRNTTSRPSRV